MSDTMVGVAASLGADPRGSSETLARVAEEHRHGSVFIRLLLDQAREAADASAVRHRSGRTVGPLDGVLLAVKDNIDVAGAPTTNGSRVVASPGPVRDDAPVVQRLRNHGMIVIGKTNQSELAFSGLGTNEHFGSPVNPLSGSVPLVTGGSSSGSAAAVAADLVPLGLGTDTSGSARVPAAFCGVVGYKASEGTFSATGVRALSPSLDSIGVLARDVEAVRLLCAALGLRRAYRQAPPSQIVRLVVPDGDEVVLACRPEVRAWFEHEAARLDELPGVTVERRPVPALREAQELMDEHGTLVAVDAHDRFGALLTEGDVDRLDPAIARRLTAASRLGPSTAARLRNAMVALREQAARQLDGALLVCPTVRHGPPALREVMTSPSDFDRLNASSLRTTMLLSYLGMPGVSLPRGHGRRAGYGLLVSGPRGSDRHVLRTASVLDDGPGSSEPGHR